MALRAKDKKFVNQIEKVKVVEKPVAPKTFLAYLAEELEATVTPQKVIQIMILLFMSSLSCVHKTSAAEDPLIVLGRSMLLLITCLILVLNHRFNQYRAGTGTRPLLPEFDYFYASFMPVLVCLVTKPSFLPFIIGCVFQVIDVPVLAKIAVSVAAQCWIANFDTSFVLALTIHWGIIKALDFFVGPALSRPEKQMGATLLVSLFFGLDSESLLQVVIFQKLTIAFFVAVVSVTPFYQFFIKEQPPVRNALVGIVYSMFATIFLYTAMRQLGPLGINPLHWILEFYIQGDRMLMLTAQIVSAALLVPSLIVLSKTWHLSWRRKAVHFILIGITGFSLVEDYEFHMMFYMVAIAESIVFEFMRASRLPPFGNIFANLLEQFLDYRDRVCDVVTALTTLLIGFLLPVLWAGAGTPAAASALVTVGLGDSFASIVGSKYGYHKWWSSNKSIEGTLSHAAVCLVGLILTNEVSHCGYSVLQLLIVAVAASLLEGSANINDNVIVPASMYVMLQSLSK